MELIIGFASSIIVEIYKWLSMKIGKKCSRKVVLVAVFLVTLVGTVIMQEELINMETMQYWVTVLSAAIATYELLIKGVEEMAKKSS